MPGRKVQPLKTRLADIGMVIFGLIMTATPLALWIAPTERWFYFVLEMFVFSSVIVWFLSSFETSAAEHQSKQVLHATKASLFERISIRLQKRRFLKRNITVQNNLRDLAEKHRRDIRNARND